MRKALTKASGVGKKTAERIVLELKDKFSMVRRQGGHEMSAAIPELAEQPACRRRQRRGGRMLSSLWGTREERPPAALAGVKDQDLSAEDYIKAALKNLI